MHSSVALRAACLRAMCAHGWSGSGQLQCVSRVRVAVQLSLGSEQQLVATYSDRTPASVSCSSYSAWLQVHHTCLLVLMVYCCIDAALAGPKTEVHSSCRSAHVFVAG